MATFQNKKRFSLVIWDFDGTIVHSLPATFAAFNAGLQHYIGRTMSDQEILNHFGPPDQDIIKTLVGAEKGAEAYELVLNHMKANIKNITVFDGVLKTIEQVSKMGLLNSIFTGRGRVSTDLIVAALQLKPHFTHIVTNDDVKNHKPHPEGIHYICNALGVQPENAIMIGDSNADVTAGKDAGTYTVGCTWSPHASHFSSASKKPDLVVHSPQELTTFLQKVLKAP